MEIILNKVPINFAQLTGFLLTVFRRNLIVGIPILLIIMIKSTVTAQATKKQEVSKNKVTVSWYYHKETIVFEMSAPTSGWVTIGFNHTQSMKGAYLLMGRIKNGETDVVEHYTSFPGNYQPIDQHSIASRVKIIHGKETKEETKIKFSLPCKPANSMQKELFVGLKYVLTMAYSRDDDFQHHSTMRTSMNITL